MSEAPALYVREGDAFVGTGCTKGSWYADGQAGGAVLALLGHVLDDVATLVPMSLTRLTVDIVRPVPVGQALWVDAEVLRDGKKIQLVDQVVRSADGAHVRARALRVRDADLTGSEGLPASSTADDPAASLPPPEQLESVEDRPGVADFLRFGAELRRTSEPVDGVHGVWLRLRVPVVAGEPVRPSSRIALPMDLVNLIGADLQRGRATAINPDVSAHVHRPPTGEWIALAGHTRFAHGTGRGFSMATMSDADGVFGVTSTSQLVQPVG